MCSTLDSLLARNHAWAKGTEPRLFQELASGQNPDVLWIGCSDSRVAPNVILNLPLGAVFVHRNIANVVSPEDVSCMSVLQYAVDVLGVRQIVVCGHYQCGGVQAVLASAPRGPVDQWLEPIRAVYQRFRTELESLENSACERRLCELNVIAQVEVLSKAAIVRAARARGAELSIGGVIFSLETGRLQHLCSA